MISDQLSLIMLPTNKCNVACEYCFEDKTAWTRNVRVAREAGIHFGVISIPNKETLRAGGEAFYSYFVDELGVTDFQVNTSFSGGELNDAKTESILDMKALRRFFVELADVWFERGYSTGVKLGPIDELLNHFMGRMASLPCIWQQNCTDNFVSIDARGHVAQCDCWVTSYPEYRFGNVFGAKSFSQLMKDSKARCRFVDRPEAMIEHETCAACDYLSICHGGCPVRAYSIKGEFFVKDPYCEVYKALFSRMEKLAIQQSRARFVRSLPVMQTRGGSVNREISS